MAAAACPGEQREGHRGDHRHSQPGHRRRHVRGLRPAREHPAVHRALYLDRCAPMPASTMQYFVGVDGLSATLMLLTGILFVVAILVSWNVTLRPREYYAWLMVLETAVMGVFAASGPHPVLPVLGARAGADVPPDLDLGHRAQRVLRDEVPALYVHRQRADARRLPGARLLRGHLRHGGAGPDGRRPARRSRSTRCSSSSSPPSRSSCPCSRCIPGCPTPTRTRRRPSA